MSDTRSKKSDSLRKQAEALLDAPPERWMAMTPEEVQSVIQELRLHEMELTLQNDWEKSLTLQQLWTIFPTTAKRAIPLLIS